VNFPSFPFSFSGKKPFDQIVVFLSKPLKALLIQYLFVYFQRSTGNFGRNLFQVLLIESFCIGKFAIYRLFVRAND